MPLNGCAARGAYPTKSYNVLTFEGKITRKDKKLGMGVREQGMEGWNREQGTGKRAVGIGAWPRQAPGPMLGALTGSVRERSKT
jgi:hypothetical protein